MTGMRGFADAEFQERTRKAQLAMAQAGLSALFLSTEPEIRYFTGFLTRFWESPTRPWFVVVPASGAPVAVIPEIGGALMAQSWITDIRTWVSPDYDDDGVGLLSDTLTELTAPGDRIGVPSGGETHLRMPLTSWLSLQDTLPDRSFVADAGILRRLRMVKSDAEIAKIRAICGIADRAFDRVPEIARPGTPLSRVFRDFQRLCLDEGAEAVSYLAGAASPGGYSDVISMATDAPLAIGDVLMLDTGAVNDGYLCDFDRNFSIGPPSDTLLKNHTKLIEATQAAFETARPGIQAMDLFHVMDKLLTGGTSGDKTGRLGHGLGMQLTEPPSLIPADDTVLEPGMVLTLEPCVTTHPGALIVHEENIVITQTGASWLSTPYTTLRSVAA